MSTTPRIQQHPSPLRRGHPERAGRTRRHDRAPQPDRGPTHPPEVAVRAPTAMDQVELRDLAHRLGETVPAQPVVVAAVDGRVVAGLSVATGVVVFDARDAGPDVRAELHRLAGR
ncbi:hypothetical protein [Patulibacter sp.]|uniref:hypothetical protein n=1 Tax=Patulibacter sp. TaxID=1912859 RepID=UPI00272487F5|nr:hypothetical protein [Patulibacter sp.]MDO9409462.1 hypothetical protein [Patulibacter sp.]